VCYNPSNPLQKPFSSMEIPVKISSVCVIGLGYIGLPTAATFATHGLHVFGVDTNPRIVNTLRGGGVPIQEPGLGDLLNRAFQSGGLSVVDRPVEADAFLIAVPTPHEDKKADLTYVRAAAESILPVLRKGNLVVLESTSPPRTTLDVVAPILESSGLRAGADFHLAYSPERVLPGRILAELVENARVIGGIDQASANAGRDLYASFVRGEIVLTDATTAETVKLMENTFRDVNIALANELARICVPLNVDVWEAIAIANRHPRVKILQPGPGVGGHCISVDPWFLVEAAPDVSALIRTAREVNDSQPAFVVESVRRTLGELKGKKIAVLGLTYKADVDDARESPAFEILHALIKAEANPVAFDPMAPELSALPCPRAASLEDAARDADCLILVVAHRAFKDLSPARLRSSMHTAVAFDCVRAWDRTAWEAAGFAYHLLGDGKAIAEA
jgi:UDP-N-acetyl-D-mannosaminuronic acid dehydrogenase